MSDSAAPILPPDLPYSQDLLQVVLNTSQSGFMLLRPVFNAAGTTILMVTHDPELAVRAQRNVHIIDGQATDIVRAAPTLAGQVAGHAA